MKTINPTSMIDSADDENVSHVLLLIRNLLMKKRITNNHKPFTDITYDTDMFCMSYTCGCGRDECVKCDIGNLDLSIDLNQKIRKAADELLEVGYPNFIHKPSGFCVWWYKHIGRGMTVSDAGIDLFPILSDCLKDISDRS